MGKAKKRQEYIHNVARTLAGRLRKPKDGWREYPTMAQLIYFRFGDQIQELINKWSDAKLGEIAACGLSFSPSETKLPTQMWYVHGKVEWLEGHGVYSGRALLLLIATTAIAAAMTDLVCADPLNFPNCRE